MVRASDHGQVEVVEADRFEGGRCPVGDGRVGAHVDGKVDEAQLAQSVGIRYDIALAPWRERAIAGTAAQWRGVPVCRGRGVHKVRRRRVTHRNDVPRGRGMRVAGWRRACTHSATRVTSG
jgi:hypothetical protein